MLRKIILTKPLVSGVIVVLLGLFISSFLVFLAGGNPAVAYLGILQGALGSGYALSSTAGITSILLLTGLSALVAFKSNIWNIGIEGQLYLGAIGATAWGIGLLPGGVQPWSGLILGFLFGAVWGAIPGFLRAKLAVDEVVSTILMNYLAVLLVDYLVSGPMKDRNQAYNESPVIAHGAALPTLIPATGLNAEIILSIPFAILVFILLYKTRFGYELRLIGGNALAARYAGVTATRTVTYTMFLSGGLAGLAGAFLISGTTHVLLVGVSNFYGYTGIAVAWLANLNPLGVVPSAIFFAILDVGGSFMQQNTGIPDTLVTVITALIIIVVLLRPYLFREGK